MLLLFFFFVIFHFCFLTQTDLRNHPDIHIQISYLEFSIRFLKLLLDDDQVINLAVSMLQSLQRHGQKLQSLYIKNVSLTFVFYIQQHCFCAVPNVRVQTAILSPTLGCAQKLI